MDGPCWLVSWHERCPLPWLLMCFSCVWWVVQGQRQGQSPHGWLTPRCLHSLSSASLTNCWTWTCTLKQVLVLLLGSASCSTVVNQLVNPMLSSLCVHRLVAEVWTAEEVVDLHGLLEHEWASCGVTWLTSVLSFFAGCFKRLWSYYLKKKRWVWVGYTWINQHWASCLSAACSLLSVSTGEAPRSCWLRSNWWVCLA